MEEDRNEATTVHMSDGQVAVGNASPEPAPIVSAFDKAPKTTDRVPMRKKSRAFENSKNMLVNCDQKVFPCPWCKQDGFECLYRCQREISPEDSVPQSVDLKTVSRISNTSLAVSSGDLASEYINPHVSHVARVNERILTNWTANPGKREFPPGYLPIFAPVYLRIRNHCCESCRASKMSCDGGSPICGSCIKKGIECKYLDSTPRDSVPSSNQPTKSSGNYFARDDARPGKILEDQTRLYACDACINLRASSTCDGGTPHCGQCVTRDMAKLCVYSNQCRQNTGTDPQRGSNPSSGLDRPIIAPPILSNTIRQWESELAHSLIAADPPASNTPQLSLPPFRGLEKKRVSRIVNPCNNCRISKRNCDEASPTCFSYRRFSEDAKGHYSTRATYISGIPAQTTEREELLPMDPPKQPYHTPPSLFKDYRSSTARPRDEVTAPAKKYKLSSITEQSGKSCKGNKAEGEEGKPCLRYNEKNIDRQHRGLTLQPLQLAPKIEPFPEKQAAKICPKLRHSSFHLEARNSKPPGWSDKHLSNGSSWNECNSIARKCAMKRDQVPPSWTTCKIQDRVYQHQTLIHVQLMKPVQDTIKDEVEEDWCMVTHSDGQEEADDFEML